MDRAIYFMLRAIFCELQSQRIALGEAERSALQAEAEASSDAARIVYSAWDKRLDNMRFRTNDSLIDPDTGFRTDEPPPASE